MSSRVALVTGANKGIGFGLVQALASSGAPNITVLLGSRSAARGEEAVKKIGRDNVRLLVVDVDDVASIGKAAMTIKADYGGLDILINNAGMAWKGDAFDEKVARGTIRTNYYGVLFCMNEFLPLMRRNARVVSISSTVSCKALGSCSESLRGRFLADNLTIDGLNDLMEEFISDVRDGVWESKGWPKSAYGISKVGVSMLTRIMARDNSYKNAGILINCCCPGYVRTDMTGPHAHLSVEEGIQTPLKLAQLPEGSPSGKFWYEGKVHDWY
ncbi:short chain dehydrogenase [Plasmodiophora brassicae]